MNLVQLARLTEDESRDYIETIIWPDGPVCPHCQTKNNATKMQGKTTRPGLWKCKTKECRKPFTVTMKTVMERSHIALNLWLMAIHLLCSSRKGFSAKQLQKELGLGSYETAWFLLHRIRYAMETGSFAPKLTGTVEVDETYVGGKPRYKGTSKRGRGTKKTPVIALVERNGNVRSYPLQRVNGATLRTAILNNVDSTSMILTDENPSYNGIGNHYDGGHDTVCHSKKEYVRGDIFTNTVESFFALIKRGHKGIYHQMSKKHLGLYCSEFAFRWNHRKMEIADTMVAAITGTQAKRLTYK